MAEKRQNPAKAPRQQASRPDAPAGLIPGQELVAREDQVDLIAADGGNQSRGESRGQCRQDCSPAPGMREAIKTAPDKRAQQAGGTALDVLREIEHITALAIEAGDLKIALKGLELLGKHLGMFVQKVEAEHSGELVIQWGGRND